MRNDGKMSVTDNSSRVMFIAASSAKQLGRTTYHPDSGILWCSHSGTGIECTVYGNRCRMLLCADSAYRCRKCAVRYAVYVNETLYADALLTVRKRYIRIPITPDGTQIRIVKLSESAHSVLGIGIIRIESSAETYAERSGRLLTASPEKAHLIEFIGDSITCGYGVDGICGKDTFSTATENAEKAFAMKTAKLLNADYSLVCFSGYGVLSGYSSDGNINQEALLPPHYCKTGHCNAKLDGMRRIDDDMWHFCRQPDLIVINLGTNDASYTGHDADRQKQFSDAYTAFLKTVREKNPDAVILCILGMMGQTLCNAVAQAVNIYCAETGEQNIRFLSFAEQIPADGFGIDWHPSAVTHEKAAETLACCIRESLKVVKQQ